MATAEKSEKLDGATFRTHRVLPYQPQAVYEAFARPDLLAHRRAGERTESRPARIRPLRRTASSGHLETGWPWNRSRVMERVLTEKPLVSFFIHRKEPCDHRRRR